MRHLFVINPRSFLDQGDFDAVLLEIKRCFASRNSARGMDGGANGMGGGGDCFIHISRFPRDAVGMIHQQMAKVETSETVRIYALGGDGILFDCINGAVGFPNAELVSVPYGKTNDYIRAFGEGKHHLFRNIDALIDETNIIPTDLIYYGNNYAINVSTVGMESTAVIRMKVLEKKYFKYSNKFPFIYTFLVFLAGFISLFDQKLIFQHYDITIDGEDYSGNYATINIANGPCYGGDMCPVPTAVPDDGYLDAQLYKSQSTLTLLRSIQRYLHGKRRMDHVLLKRAKKVSIRSGKPLLIQLDGEMLVDTNITMEVAPHAIRMVTPKGLRYERRAPFDA
ncbi:diacylglycerol/lipid kinase family protein [Treponema primitia]|uniref:diacylglycerol/lipid kinase family protein n=1 Tax=Treponema primitia TaxID=88058 RepID=UPI0002555423|nr:diacylglycerol kinase family protein [Treponema primitia]